MSLQGHGLRIMGTGFGSVGFRLIDCASITPCRNIVCERYQHDRENNFQYFYPAVALVDYGAVSLQVSEVNTKRYKEGKSRNPEEYPEIEPPEDEREELPPLSTAQAMEYAASKKAAKPSDPEQRMASHAETLMDMQGEAKKRRAKLLEKESKQKAIDVDAESTGRQEGSTSKKARGGKGQGDETSIWTKESLPPGHWQDRPRSSESQETKRGLASEVGGPSEGTGPEVGSTSTRASTVRGAPQAEVAEDDRNPLRERRKR